MKIAVDEMPIVKKDIYKTLDGTSKNLVSRVGDSLLHRVAGICGEAICGDDQRIRENGRRAVPIKKVEGHMTL